MVVKISSQHLVDTGAATEKVDGSCLQSIDLPLLIATGGSINLLCLEGFPHLPGAPQHVGTPLGLAQRKRASPRGEAQGETKKRHLCRRQWRLCARSPALLPPRRGFALLLLCLTLCDPRDGSPPGSPVPGILQARTLEWIAIYS